MDDTEETGHTEEEVNALLGDGESAGWDSNAVRPGAFAVSFGLVLAAW
ncbi:hypothetical protein [Streptomyces goshikiensis]